MAGDWIKIEENTPDKPEVCQIAHTLGLDPDAVTGKLSRIWAWASRNCHADGVTSVTVKALLDRISGVTGFCDAMEKAGWLVADGDRMIFPNFNYHISESAKDRAQTSRRQHKHRDKCHANTVTNVTQEALLFCDKNVTREEKRREENNNTPVNIKASPKCFAPPTLAEVSDYCQERKNNVDPQRWIDFYSAKGWMVGKNKMKDWRAGVRTWEKPKHSEPGRDYSL